jgi:phospholipase C
MAIDRRTFLQLLSTGALSAAFPASIARALKIPANSSTGTIEDVQHIVILMQENRSFDHYFGTLRGVRGYGDPRAVTLSTGNPVWYQPHGRGYVLPFHPGAPNLGLQFLQDLEHDWASTHVAWNEGSNDQWVLAKGTNTMAHLTRSDIPFHYALADAFTICDAYHCSLMGPTDPNRYYMWTGWVGNDGQGGGPVVDNAETGYNWSTYPELLLKAGVSWKIYQDVGMGLDGFISHSSPDPYIGNYGDNTLLFFRDFENARPGSPLHDRAKTGTNISEGGTLFDILRQDVLDGNLPQVSWIVAPEAYTEHPNWPANYGAWYVSQILDALTANPAVWSQTAFFLTYDENDGFFDHMVSPTPPQSAAQGVSTVGTTYEIFAGTPRYPAGPYGLGPRVPMLVISPWSKGGWVNSQVFDHTSLIQFIEKRFGVKENNITPWRRAVAGDLTSAFNFASPNDAAVSLPGTVAYRPPDNKRHPDYIPKPPEEQAMPVQESGTRPARALPYVINVHAQTNFVDRTVSIYFSNASSVGVVFHVRSGDGRTGPWTYTVGPNAELTAAWAFTEDSKTAYDLSVYGPNGFLRSFKGSLSDSGNANLQITSAYDAVHGSITLSILNEEMTFRENAVNSHMGRPIPPAGPTYKVSILDAYTKETITRELPPKAAFTQSWPLASTFGWYDFVVEVNSDSGFQQRLSGHVETGRDSVSDPAIGAPV